jgi:16S rRNA (guanine527-N7)-methyltransferase
MNLDADLRQGALDLGLALNDDQVRQLLAYLELIGKWNKVYNLTAVRDPQDMLRHHVLDSLAVVGPLARHLAGRAAAVLDVGSGGGLPGVVLAICLPQLKVDCVDAVAKKAAFIQQVAASLGLPNLKGVHARVESLRGPYDVVTSRAFASLRDFVTWSGDALAPEGVWMAMKGKSPGAEAAELPGGIAVFHVEQLQVPQLDAERCLVWMKRAPASP